MSTAASAEHIPRDARVGVPLELELLTPGVSGHLWRLEPEAGPSWRLVDRRIEARGGLGIGPRILLTVAFSEAGLVSLTAVLQRPWEDTPSRRIVFDVEVAAA